MCEDAEGPRGQPAAGVVLQGAEGGTPATAGHPPRLALSCLRELFSVVKVLERETAHVHMEQRCKSLEGARRGTAERSSHHGRTVARNCRRLCAMLHNVDPCT